MYSLMGLLTSIAILLLFTSHEVYKYVMNTGYKSWYKYFMGSTMTTTNTLEIPLRTVGVAAETAELMGCRGASCFSQFLLVLSYSGLSLLSLQSLQRPSTETV